MKKPIPNIAPESREANFREVNQGYLLDDALAEVSRCLECENPACMEGCPLNINIPEFLQCIKNRDTKSAMMIIREANPFPSICSRICPYEKLCEGKCRLNETGSPMPISHLARFAADNEDNIFIYPNKIPKIRKEHNAKKTHKNIAIVGSGPAGLACASGLVSKGHNAIIYEAMHEPGGSLRRSIPEFKLPKDIVETEINNLKKKGVNFILNHVIGKTLTINDLKKEYDAIFIATGAGQPHLPKIPGEHLRGAITATEFLTRINLMNSHRFPDYDTPIKKQMKIIVVGGNDMAVDSARTAKRLGADVTILYKSVFDDMPARKMDIEHAKEEGINFMFLTYPTRIIGKNHVKEIEIIQMMLEGMDPLGRKKAVPIENTEFTMECDKIIFALGQKPSPIIAKSTNISHRGDGSIVVDEKLRTSKRKVFAGGGAISGTDNPILAIRDGKIAAVSIDEMLRVREEE